MQLVSEQEVDRQKNGYDGFSEATAYEIKFMLKVIKAQEKLLASYRLGRNNVPEWALQTLAKAREEGLII